MDDNTDYNINNDVVRFGFPSLSTGLNKVPINEASIIACEQWKIICDPQQNLKYQRFKMIQGNLTNSNKIRYIAIEVTWRLKLEVTSLGKWLIQQLGKEFSQEIKKLYPNPGVVGEVYPVPIPINTDLHKTQGVEQLICVVSPNMSCYKTDPLELEDAKRLLKESYKSMLTAFWDLKNNRKYIQLKRPNPKVTQYDVTATCEKADVSTAAKPKVFRKRIKDSNKVASSWQDGLIPYTINPQIYPEQEVYSYDDDLVVIWDKYPKGKKHLLIMPRFDIDGIEDLLEHDLELIKKMKQKGEWVVDR
ncbi:10387_t:CDS:2 [Entrophospora sp. SA101]|nr:7897_t:CDS:2 [Entrophospora sp. SA101]CAJ0843578.1 10387_t:CDS:2 [Entrophospora sp. SA101]CAJ0916808.1 408_t:CDS:2 [Entrophospora sp. SA101]